MNFSAVNSYKIPMSEFASAFTITDLQSLTNESVDQLISLIQTCSDADIIFVPDDRDAYDSYAARFRTGEAHMGWSIGHNIVHATASAEEYAYDAAGLARGVPYHGRSRFELPWQLITTTDKCLARLEENRRMRLASLEMWPDEPDLENGVTPWQESGWVNAIGLFAWGIAHDASHIQQIRKIMNKIGTE